MKLGGSVITYKDQPKTENIETIRRICREIKEAKQECSSRLILGTGGGSFAHYVAHQYAIKEGLFNERTMRGNLSGKEGHPSPARSFRANAQKGFALTHDAAAEINHIVVHECLQQDILVVSMQPSAFVVCEDGKITNLFLQPIQNLLDVGLIPVVYGDVVTDTARGCSIISTEMELSALATRLGSTRLIMCTDVDGVYETNPHTNPNAKLIPEITPSNFPSFKSVITSSHATDVTGGMLHKVESLLALTQFGIKSHIINGMTPGLVKRAILGEESFGTMITQ